MQCTLLDKLGEMITAVRRLTEDIWSVHPGKRPGWLLSYEVQGGHNIQLIHSFITWIYTAPLVNPP